MVHGYQLMAASISPESWGGRQRTGAIFGSRCDGLIAIFRERGKVTAPPVDGRPVPRCQRIRWCDVQLPGRRQGQVESSVLEAHANLNTARGSVGPCFNVTNWSGATRAGTTTPRMKRSSGGSASRWCMATAGQAPGAPFASAVCAKTLHRTMQSGDTIPGYRPSCVLSRM